MQISDAPRAPFMRPMGRGRLKYGCGIAQCGACRAPPGPLAPGSISRTIPHGLPRGDLAQPPEAGTCACLTLDAATAAFPDAAAVRTRGVTGDAEASVAFRASEERWLGTVSA